MQESSDEEVPRSNSPSSDGGDPGSDSDHEVTHPSLNPPQQMSSIEMSLWSLDASATSSLDASITTDTEVSEVVSV